MRVVFKSDLVPESYFCESDNIVMLSKRFMDFVLYVSKSCPDREFMKIFCSLQRIPKDGEICFDFTPIDNLNIESL